MLDFEAPAGALSREEQQILDETDRFARGELYPLAARMDHEEWWPDDLFPRLGDAGYLGIAIPESLGGQGSDLFASGLVLQAIARWNPAVALSWVAHDNLCLDNLYRNGTDEQRRRYVPGLCSGKSVGALGLTEPGAGSDAIGSLRTAARRDGDHYILNGTKLYITNGPIADVCIVYAVIANGAIEAPTLTAIPSGPSAGASARSSSSDGSLDSRSRKSCRKWDFAAAPQVNSSSTTAACPPRTCYKAKAAALPCSWADSISSAR